VLRAGLPLGKLEEIVATDWVDMDMASGIFKLMAAESDKASQCLMTSMGDWAGTILAETGTNVPGRDFVGTVGLGRTWSPCSGATRSSRRRASRTAPSMQRREPSRLATFTKQRGSQEGGKTGSQGKGFWGQ
jgi:hypothetical protein